MPPPSLPPAFHLVALDPEVGAFARAVRAAPRGVDDGTLYWTERSDRVDLAVVLEPESPAAQTLEALYVLTVAAGDALGAALPPVVPVAYGWPGDLILAGARVGRVRAALAPVADADGVPPWLVVGLQIDVAALGDDPVDVKKRCIALETEHLFARLVDLDVYSAGGIQVDRGSLGLPSRRCLVCSRPAVECMRLKRHHYREVIAKVHELLTSFRT